MSKNFLVPVSKDVVLLLDKMLAPNVGWTYARHAIVSLIVDLFVTLISMGLEGYKKLLRDQTELLKTTF